jgi:hypothetical protein
LRLLHVLVVAVLAGATAAGAQAAPLSAEAWPECHTLKPGARFEDVGGLLGARGHRLRFAMVDNLPVTTYAFRRAARTCRVQIEEGVVLATPVLR